MVAFVPKALAVVLAIPAPVAAAYITVLLGLLFVVGMRIVIQDGIDYRKGLIAGVSFWLGVGLQNGAIFPEHISGIAGGVLDNGITAGGLVAILLTLFVELTAPAGAASRRPSRSRRYRKSESSCSPSPPAAAGARRWRTASTPPPRRRS